MGRSTIYYDSFCDKPISDAISVLNKMKESQKTAMEEITTRIVWILAISFFCGLTVYQIVNLVMYSKRSCREGELCCCRPCCLRANRLVFAGISILGGTAMLTMTSISFGTIFPKFDSLMNWADFSDCVEEYE